MIAIILKKTLLDKGPTGEVTEICSCMHTVSEARKKYINSFNVALRWRKTSILDLLVLRTSMIVMM